jgi:hypothetical protein
MKLRRTHLLVAEEREREKRVSRERGGNNSSAQKTVWKSVHRIYYLKEIRKKNFLFYPTFKVRINFM